MQKLILALVCSVLTALPTFAVNAAIGDITTYAGTGSSGYSGDNGLATSAKLGTPIGIAIDSADNVFIADFGSSRIRKIDSNSGIITTVAGAFSPTDVAVDRVGNLYIADSRHRIRKVDNVSGIITTVAGTGISGFSGDGGLATNADLDSPYGIAIDMADNLFIADAGNKRIRKVDAINGIITTVAGTGTAGFSGDGGPALNADLNGPAGLAIDREGNLFIADSANHLIRKIDYISGIITTVAGTGIAGFSGDGGAATNADLKNPLNTAIDSKGSLYIADSANDRIRKVDTNGDISTIAGDGAGAFFSGDGGPATAASLNFPTGIAFDTLGNLYFADSENYRIRKVQNTTLGTGLIGDFVWQDLNGNGVQDNNEPGLDGVTVNLWLDCNSTTNQSTVTSNGGAFLFDELAAGTYQLEFIKPVGYSFSPTISAGDYTIDSNANPITGRDTCRTLGDDQRFTGLDAGLIPSDGPMDTLIVLNAIYYPIENKIWVRASSDALAGSAIITVTAVTNGVETVLGQLGWKAGKSVYQQAFKNLAQAPDTIKLTSHLGGMVTAAIEDSGGGSNNTSLRITNAIYYSADSKLWIRAYSDASPAGSATITAVMVINGIETVLGQVGWKPSKNTYQQMFKNITLEPDSMILNSNMGDTTMGPVSVQ